MQHLCCVFYIGGVPVIEPGLFSFLKNNFVFILLSILYLRGKFKKWNVFSPGALTIFIKNTVIS
ncbi:hypothetical protein SAMN05444274_102275 [Mariniphaga anaerophila]|uniref:Uncharacterized protein n=1 Tax=Mariniphaga anaerophila TaxID=1484053 RepID=A0A1M4W0X7_9BACT|nr:hypothetical protein SAMN05444274_102275 [Mariniphaga anaerophila]